MHRFTSILRDEAPHQTRGRLAYSHTGSPCIHDLLLQKADGALWLILWGERVEGEEPVTLTLDRKRKITEYDPTVDTQPRRTLQGKSLTLTMDQSPIILKLEK